VFRVYATIDEQTSPAQVTALARRAEAIGFDALLVADVLHARYGGLATMLTFPLPEDAAHDAAVATVVDCLHA